jgi:hypothetical protein
MHVHLDHDNCLEVILVRGKASIVQKLANALIAVKGVSHGRFTATTPGVTAPGLTAAATIIRSDISPPAELSGAPRR